MSVLLQDGPPSGDGASGVPSCDPLVEACVPAAAEEEAPPAAPSGGEGPAVGRNRMSDLRAVRLRAFCAENGSVRVRLRVRATKPRLVSRVWVRFTVSRQGAATGVTVRVRERTLLSVPAVFPAVAAGGPACGRSVVARLDPGDRLAERRERENTNSVRIRAHP